MEKGTKYKTWKKTWILRHGIASIHNLGQMTILFPKSEISNLKSENN